MKNLQQYDDIFHDYEKVQVLDMRGLELYESGQHQVWGCLLNHCCVQGILSIETDKRNCMLGGMTTDSLYTSSMNREA